MSCLPTVTIRALLETFYNGRDRWTRNMDESDEIIVREYSSEILRPTLCQMDLDRPSLSKQNYSLVVLAIKNCICERTTDIPFPIRTISTRPLLPDIHFRPHRKMRVQPVFLPNPPPRPTMGCGNRESRPVHPFPSSRKQSQQGEQQRPEQLQHKNHERAAPVRGPGTKPRNATNPLLSLNNDR